MAGKESLARVDEVARTQGFQQLTDHMGKDGDGRIVYVQSQGRADSSLNDELGSGATACIEEIALLQDLDKLVPDGPRRRVPFVWRSRKGSRRDSSGHRRPSGAIAARSSPIRHGVLELVLDWICKEISRPRRRGEIFCVPLVIA